MRFAALGAPIRLSLYRRLIEIGAAGCGPTALAKDAGLQRNLASYHLQPLVAAGLVKSERRGRDVNYTVDAGALSELILAVLNLKPLG